jgi:hypothetical protein
MWVVDTKDAEGEMSEYKQNILGWLILKFQNIRKQKREA